MDEATVKKIVARRRGMAKVRKACDDKLLPYPPELISYLLEGQGPRRVH